MVWKVLEIYIPIQKEINDGYNLLLEDKQALMNCIQKLNLIAKDIRGKNKP